MASTMTTARVAQSSHEEALLRYARTQRDLAAEKAGKLVGDDGSVRLDAAERRALDGHLAAMDMWSARVADVDATITQRRVSVTREPLTYARERNDASFFHDLLIQRDGGVEAMEARGRLERHSQEMRVELPAREARLAREHRSAMDRQGVEYGQERRLSGRFVGFGGSFAPPLWLIDQFATASRPGRTLADLVTSFPLRDGVASVNVPRFAEPTIAQPAADGSAVPSSDFTDAAVTSPCTPIAGYSDVPLAMIEQSPSQMVDVAIWKDLTESYDARLEALMVSGTGTGGTFVGLLALPTGAGAVNAIVYTDATPTGPRLFTSFGKAAAQIGDNRLMPPEVWLMRTARWAWLGSAEDGQGLPLALPGHMPPPPIAGLFDDHRPVPVAPLLGWPIYPDDAIPANLGADADQDAVIACRPSDMLLFESEPIIGVGTEVLSGTLGARIDFRAYAAFLGGRRPTGVSTITGTGLAVQAGE